MVRIKHRYLLLNILYPSSQPFQSQPHGATPSYLHFHAPTPPNINPGTFIRLLKDSIEQLFGDYGVGSTAPSLKCNYLSNATSTAIVRCPRAHFRLVWMALTFINSLPSARRGEEATKCVILVVRVSGTIRKAEEELVRRARRDIVKAKMAGEGQGKLDTLLSGIGAGGRRVSNIPAEGDYVSGIEDYSDDEDKMEDDFE